VKQSILIAGRRETSMRDFPLSATTSFSS
jgi:hypothetical protein